MTVRQIAYGFRGGTGGECIDYEIHDMVHFNKILRIAEYHLNNGHKIRCLFFKFRLARFGRKLGWSVECNSFGPGMCIMHYGTVVVNGNARIGENARLQAGVNIGASGGNKECPVIGDNVYFGPGAKVFGNIQIASNVAIAANAVVNKSCMEEGVTLGGIPAKIISRHGTENLIRRYSETELALCLIQSSYKYG